MTTIFRKQGIWLLALVALTLIVTSDSAVAERGEFGVLVRVRGTVRYQAAGAVTWVQASERMRVNAGDKLSAGTDGEAVVKLADRNYVAIKANSQVTLSAHSSRTVSDPDNKVMGMFPARVRVTDSEMDLARGRTINVMRGLRREGTYKLHTPIATAGVRGTVFLAEVVPANRGQKQAGNGEVACNFAVTEGTVGIQGNPGSGIGAMDLGVGQSASFVGMVGAGGVLEGPATSAPVAPINTNVQSEVQNFSTNVEKTENQGGEERRDASPALPEFNPDLPQPHGY